MVIELFGLPGSGKTTLAKGLVTADSSYKTAREVSAFAGIWYMVVHPRNGFFWLYQIVHESYRTRTWKLFRFKIALLLRTFAQMYVARDVSGKALLEEGMLQRVLSIFETKKEAADIERALTHLILPDVLVSLIGDEEYYFKRYRQKDNPRAALGEAYLQNWIKTARHNHAQILVALNTVEMSYYTYDYRSATLEDMKSYIEKYERSTQTA